MAIALKERHREPREGALAPHHAQQQNLELELELQGRTGAVQHQSPRGAVCLDPLMALLLFRSPAILLQNLAPTAALAVAGRGVAGPSPAATELSE